MDGYIELFRQAVERRLSGGSAALPLSGGSDSRHIPAHCDASFKGHETSVGFPRWRFIRANLKASKIIKIWGALSRNLNGQQDIH